MTRLPLHLCLLALTLGACAGEDGERGPAGEAGDEGGFCTVATAAGKATITCPDGSSTVLESETCSVESDRGVHTITCPGAEPVVIEDGDRIRNGTIVGKATLFGLPPSEEIEVSVVDTSVRPRKTDEEGNFQLSAVPAGLHRVRLTAPGHAPLEIPNVLVAGGTVELEELVLRRARKLGDRFIMAAPSRSGEKLALVEIDPMTWMNPSLRILDLVDGSIQWVTDEIDHFEFIDDRFVLVRRPWDDDWEEAEVHDLRTGNAISLGPVSETYVTELGGLLYGIPNGGESILYYLSLPGTDPHVLGTAEIAQAFYDEDERLGRFIAISTDDGVDEEYWLVDLANPAAEHVPLLHPYIAYDPGSGLVAYVQEDEGEEVVQLLDPASGVIDSLGAVPADSRLVWSPGAAFLGAHGPTGVVVFDRETGERVSWAIAAEWELSFSPSGAKIYGDDPGGAFVGDWATQSAATIPATSALAYSESEAWAASCAGAETRLIDLEGATSSLLPLPCWRAYFVGELLFIVHASSLTRYEPGTGTSTTFTGSADHYGARHPLPVVLSEDPSEGDIVVTDALTGETKNTGIPWGSSDWDFPDAPYVLIEELDSSSVYLLDLRDGEVLPIDDQVEGAETHRQGLTYIRAKDTGSPMGPAFESYWLFWP